MSLRNSTLRYFLIIAIPSALGAAIISQFPTLSVGATSVQTSLIVALVAGILLISTAISAYWSGKQRVGLLFGMFAAGILLSQIQYSILPTLGALTLLACAGIGLEIDKRLLSMVSQQ